MSTLIEEGMFARSPNGSLELLVFRDAECRTPRSWADNLCVFALNHRRCFLPWEASVDKDDICSHEHGCELLARAYPTGSLVLPVRGYDHGGLAMSLSTGYPFNDRWDSGWLGWIVCPSDSFKDEFGWRNLSARRRAKMREVAERELRQYDDWGNGLCWRFELLRDGKVVDKDGGLIGRTVEETGLLDELCEADRRALGL
jgi:hypothetical protein